VYYAQRVYHGGRCTMRRGCTS